MAHMQGMMPHQGLGPQMVHPTPGGGAQMQGQWRQPLGGQETPVSDAPSSGAFFNCPRSFQRGGATANPRDGLNLDRNAPL